MSRTNVPRPCSRLTRPIVSSSAYTRVAVTTAMPSRAASARWVGSRAPGARRPVRMSDASASTSFLYREAAMHRIVSMTIL